MEAIFVDTSAWDAIEDGGDSYHAAALRFKEELAQQGVRLYATNFVLDEGYTLLLRNVAMRVRWRSSRRSTRCAVGSLIRRPPQDGTGPPTLHEKATTVSAPAGLGVAGGPD